MSIAKASPAKRFFVEMLTRDIELADALKLFEEGIAHLRAAQAVLSTAELHIERLVENAAGVRTEPLRGDIE